MSKVLRLAVDDRVDNVPIAHRLWVVVRIGAGGLPEFRGAFATEAAALADPVIRNAPAGWKVSSVNLIGFGALVLEGET
jgi:hypothetical protein